MSKKSQSLQNIRLILSKSFILIGNVLILISALFLVLSFGPVAMEEIKFQASDTLNIPEEIIYELEPANTDFSIQIPKIGASAPIVSDVDPYNSAEYLNALKSGVAHAKGTSLPDRSGNIYLFAHSTDAFYNVGRYNAVFYLIGKLASGDEVDIYYKNNLYKYEVADKRVVEPTDIEYLKSSDGKDTLTLQTCYPPGITLKRLVVIANKI